MSTCISRRSTAQHVPTDGRVRSGYRRGVRRVFTILDDLLELTK